MPPAIVGREQELEAVAGFAQRIAAGGAGGALLLEGEPGVGKSTLFDAAVIEVSRVAAVVVARPAEAETSLAHAALGDLLEGSLEHVLPRLPLPRRRALEQALLLADSAAFDQRTLAVAVRSVLQLLAEDAPVVVAVDDVQWLDAATHHVLAFALRRLRDEPVHVLLARRGDSAETDVVQEVDARDGIRVPVGPLSLGAVAAVVGRRLGRPLPRPALLRVYEASGGNPFYAIELARVVRPDAEATEPLPLPPSLESLVSGRVAGLAGGTREALLLAAVAGRLTASAVDEADLRPALDAGIVEVRGETVRFTHPLLASGVLSLASTAERRAAHARASELAPDGVARARHAALAASGTDSELATALDEAVAAAAARGAAPAAAELAEHALRATPAADEQARHTRALAAARAQVAAGAIERARALATEAVERAQPGVPRAKALETLAAVEDMFGAVVLLERALVEGESDPRLSAALHRRLALIGRFARGRRWAEEHARTAVALAESCADQSLRAASLATLALMRFDQGDPAGRDDAEHALALAEGVCSPEDLLEVQFVVGHIRTWSTDFVAARAVAEPVYEAWRDRDERTAHGALWYLAFIDWQEGRWEAAAAKGRAVYDVFRQYGQPRPQQLFLFALAAVHLGDVELGRRIADEASALATATEAQLGGVTALHGLIALWEGDPRRAVGAFAAAEAAAAAADWGEPNLCWWRAEYAEALLELGRVDEAEVLLAGWEEVARRVGRTRVLAHACRARGLAAAARGDVDGAVGLLEEATGLHLAAGDPFGRARALYALGVVRRRARQKRPARDALVEALAGFDAIGAATWSERAREELGRVGGRTQVDGLTPAERRVAVLVAEGRTNREVAAALFLGERTVASHLTHIYAKLGVRSRTELAAKVQTF